MAKERLTAGETMGLMEELDRYPTGSIYPVTRKGKNGERERREERERGESGERGRERRESMERKKMLRAKMRENACLC